MTTKLQWFSIDNIDELDTPALVVYPGRVKENIARLLSMQSDTKLLRPHAKTSKMKELASMLMDVGINSFKCATIAEAHMLAMADAKDVFLAYQPIGPKILRLLDLQKKYPDVKFSCLIDNEKSAHEIGERSVDNNIIMPVWIDLNTGMGRTGISTPEAQTLYKNCLKIKGIKVIGLHAYDGHLNDSDLEIRTRKCLEAFNPALQLLQDLQKEDPQLRIVAGGSGTFPIYAKMPGVQASPGTFVFWDYNYTKRFPDIPFEYAALLVTRVLSKIDQRRICLDLGHKSVAAEMPFPRVYFFNEPDAVQVSQSEEHLVVEVENSDKYQIGDVWYAAPSHICPTVALYETVAIIENNKFVNRWRVIARDRFI